MNYFGLFFSFMIPGIIVGAMITSVVMSVLRRRGVTSNKRVM